MFAGLRPLVAVGEAKETSALSRDHAIFVSNSGLITITGGKWTTYRKMAQDVIDQAELVAGLDGRPCTTEGLRIHGWAEQGPSEGRLGLYGSDAEALQQLSASEPQLASTLTPEVEVTGAQVVWAARAEMARTVEDVLSRRTRALLLGARASIDAAPAAARLMARELGRDEAWEARMVRDYRELALRYVLTA